ncbi:MAG TPA: hypothetical protein VFU85_02550 [Nocardioides sp.]|nr:hypothetical protein [Nocardioides sp.]
MTISGNPARRLVALALSAVLLAGCGGESSPADAAPELADQLARVDRAVAAGDEARIRDRVESLVAATEAARDSGRLDDEQADRILTAADALIARLPAEEPRPKPSPSPTSSSPTPSPTPDEEAEEEREEKEEEPKPAPHEKPEKPEKGKGQGKKG